MGKTTKHLWFQPKVFAPGELRRGLTAILNDLGRTSMDITLHETFPDGTEHRRNLTPEDLVSICELKCDVCSLSVDFQELISGAISYNNRRESLSFFSDDEAFLSIYVEAEGPDDLSQLIALIGKHISLTAGPSRVERKSKQLELELPPGGMNQRFKEITERIEKLEEMAAAHAKQIVAFLSFRFDGKAVDYAQQLRRFLELLDVRVITGEAYEPRRVSEKVQERLSGDIDLVVVIQTVDGASSWMRDEMARAQQGAFLVPLVEEGAVFEKGIYSDHEFIRFTPDHIGDAFFKVLEAIAYIRRRRSLNSADGSTQTSSDSNAQKATA
jgi:hypothetical protein